MGDYVPGYQVATTWSGEALPAPDLRMPMRGQRILDKEEADARLLAIEKREKGIAKKRDGRCRWPEKHTCRGGDLEAAHVKDASTGGEMAAHNLITVCPWIHRRGPESIHGKQLKVEAETEPGAAVPLFSFWRQTGTFDALGQPDYYLVARETAPFRLERD